MVKAALVNMAVWCWSGFDNLQKGGLELAAFSGHLLRSTVAHAEARTEMAGREPQPEEVELDLAFGGIAPLLWLRSGGRGRQIEDHGRDPTRSTNGSVNPTLTIVANAIRVAEHLVADWPEMMSGGREF